MRDRVPTYPGRVTLVPVPGQENTFDMVRADEPIEPGSIWNKANVLPDEVCDALGVDRVTAEPKDALTALKSYTDTAAQKVRKSFPNTFEKLMTGRFI